MDQTQTATPEPRRLSPGVWKIPSKSRPGICHTARLNPLDCTCEWVRFGSMIRTGRSCLHLIDAWNAEEEFRQMTESPAVPVQDPPDDDPFASDRAQCSHRERRNGKTIRCRKRPTHTNTDGRRACAEHAEANDNYTDEHFPFDAAPEIIFCPSCTQTDRLGGTTAQGERLCWSCWTSRDPSHPDAVRVEASPAVPAVQPVTFSVIWSDGKVPSPMSYREAA